jgi:hypothetical protein
MVMAMELFLNTLTFISFQTSHETNIAMEGGFFDCLLL